MLAEVNKSSIGDYFFSIFCFIVGFLKGCLVDPVTNITVRGSTSLYAMLVAKTLLVDSKYRGN